MSLQQRSAEEIFNAARTIADPKERDSYLRDACGSDLAMRARIDALLKADAEAGSFLADGKGEPNARSGDIAVEGDPDATVAHRADRSPKRFTEMPGMQIGPYRLLERIGEGGFGEVWVADQREPVRRKVALKIVKAGMDSREVLARFEAERQALALMDHPGVAKVFDAGATDSGRPYFVMEHVAGLPINEYCDTTHLKISDRLSLFMDVCQVVQHAHQKGIIHRDLKPSNILVALNDGRPAPKVIDFGIAKATLGRLTERTLYTEVGRMMGTPEYMAPEQTGTSGLDVDTRADIYSLGVILYELLTGTLPFDPKTLRNAGFDAMAKIIRELEPPKPSTRLSTLAEEAVNRRNGKTPEDIARGHDTDFRTLRREVRGDLDWITLKALEKDRTRRYATASAFADDVARHLNHEPVLAGSPTISYRLRKLVRRNRALVSAIAVLFFVLVSSTVVSTSLYWDAKKARSSAIESRDLSVSAQNQAERDRQVAQDSEANARLETAKTKAVTDFLRNMLGSADPMRARGRDVTVREVLDEASGTVEAKLGDQPEVQAQVRATIGWTYISLGFGEQAIPHLQWALSVFREKLGSEHATTLSTLRDLGLAHHLVNNNKEFVAAIEEYFATARRLFAEDDPTTVDAMSFLGNAYDNLGDYKKAEPLLVRANELAMRIYSKDDWRLVGTRGNLGALYWHLGRFSEAEKAYSESLAESNLAPQFKVRMQNELALVYLAQGTLDKAEETARAALEKGVQILGHEHPATVMTMRTLANVLALRGGTSEAEDLYRKAIDASRPILTSRRVELRDSLRGYVELLDRTGRLNDAEQQVLAVLDVERQVLGDDDPETLGSLVWLTHFAAAQGAVERARHYQESQIEPRNRMVASSKASAQSLNDYAWALLTIEPEEFRDPTGALPVAEKAVELSGRKDPSFLDTLAHAYRMAGEFERTKQTYDEVISLVFSEESEAAWGSEHALIAGLVNLIDSVREKGDLPALQQQVCESAEKAGRMLLAKRQAAHHEMTHVAQNYLALALVKCGKFAEAEPLVRETLEHRRASLPQHHWLIGNSMSLLGETLLRQGKLTEAEALLVGGFEQIRRDPQAPEVRKREALDRIRRLYEAWDAAEPGKGYAAKAEEYRALLEAKHEDAAGK